MEGPISFWGYKEQESTLIVPEHDDEWWSLVKNKTLARMGTIFVSQVICVIKLSIYEYILELLHPPFLKADSGIYMYIYIKSLWIWLGTNTMVDFSKREVWEFGLDLKHRMIPPKPSYVNSCTDLSWWWCCICRSIFSNELYTTRKMG